jgi:hypothetical protein
MKFMNAVAIIRVNSMFRLRPRRPANKSLISNQRVPGALFSQCGRQAIGELQNGPATAAPSQDRHELQVPNAGRTLSTECGRHG